MRIPIPDIVQSTDAGESWKSILIDSKSTGKKQSLVKFSSNSNLVVADGTLYGIADEEENLRIYRLPTDANVFVPIQGIPAFYKEMLSTELWKSVAEVKLSLPDEARMDPNLVKALRGTVTQAITGGFAISNGTFYVEYQRVLFKWKPGYSEWKNTGLIDLDEQSRPTSWRRGFRLAASGEAVYVGKRDGTLFQSLDAGESWKDITSSLPLHFTCFKEIVFAGSTVYIATDEGVLASQNGEHWRVLTTETGVRPVIDRLTAHYTNVYGAGECRCLSFR